MARLGIWFTQFKDRRIEIGEKLRVQSLNGGGEIGARDHESKIQRRRALRQHADIDAAERVEHARRNARSVADVFTHNADDSLILVHRNFGELAQFRDDRFHALGLIDGQRDADFGRGHHVHRSLIAVENLEDAPHETMRHEHARGSDVQHHHFAFAGDGLHNILARNCRGLDARAFHLRPARIQNHDRNIAVDGGHHGGRMQNLRAEIGQLGGFGERDHFHAMRARNDGRIGREHAVHVGPDLDLFGANARADDGRRKIGPAAAERGGDAIFGGCDEAAHHHHVLLRQRRNGGRELGVGLRRTAEWPACGDDR